jgi:ornithine carbamoyltransferase
MESSYTGAAAEPRTPNQDLVRIADELLEQTRALRRQHEELRDALAGIRVVARDEPHDRGDDDARAEENGSGGAPNAIHSMVLQMALAGETRESAKEQLHALGADDADAIVDEVFDRTESQRSDQQRRRLFSRG